MIRKFGGTSGIDFQPQGIDLGLGGSNIKSIQRGIISISATTTTSISAVDTSCSIVLISSYPTTLGSSYLRDSTLSADLQDSTTVKFYYGGVASTQKVEWIVIEFNNVKSLQKGVLSMTSSGDTTVTITNIKTDKSILFMSIYTTNSTSQSAQMLETMKAITDSVTLTFSQNSSYSKSIYWQIIEFN